MKSIDDIVSGFHNTLAILESEEVEVVGGRGVGRAACRALPYEEFSPIPLEDHSRLLFSFKNEFDKRKIMRESPWNFDRALLLLGAKYGWVDPSILPLDSPCFWV
ncbi:hypothetical protein L3X38_010741 [Prunus dulcis]|uniref:Uncharacterized protein n=1 Tax=Prunus dulcis TaxID=3755 RepID=A0AAD4ZEC4_PRUDU|nr:hypothetical protein L3X38_010741 [Prunus dulcis]